MKRLTPLLAAGVLFVVPPQDAASPSEELEQVLRELRDLRRQHVARSRDLEAQIDEARTQARDAEKRVQAARTQRESEQGITQQLDDEVQTLQQEHDALAQRRDGLLRTLSTFADQQVAVVAEGIPYRVDARTAPLSVAHEIESVAELISAITKFVRDELRVSRSGEAFTDAVPLPDGRTRHARFLRVGQRLLGFVTEDGQDVGLWVPGEGWVLDVERVRAEEIRRGIEILDRRSAPDWVVLPVVPDQ